MNPIWLSIFLIFFQEPVADPPAPTLVSVEPAPVVQGTTVAITFRGTGFVARQTLPEMPATVTPLVYAIPVQLIAYHTAVIMGTDVDQPRNLAKSVTVE